METDVLNVREYLSLNLGLSADQTARLQTIRERYRIEYRQKHDLMAMDRAEIYRLDKIPSR